MATVSVSGAGYASSRSETARFALEDKLAGYNILVAFIALALGGLFGVFQAWEYSGVNTYPALKTIGIQSRK